jgi:hypothetical protein
MVMFARGLRVVGFLLLIALALWWGRLLAHSKVPPPAGRWREITDDELG